MLLPIQEHYLRWSLPLRLTVLTFLAVALNAAYCLIYRFSQGSPETVFNAVAWGVINIAPWIIAIELAREARRWDVTLVALAAAFLLSLLLGSAFAFAPPDVFDVVRRLPALAASLLCLGILLVWPTAQIQRAKPETKALEKLTACDFVWARSAGNYIELHGSTASPRLVRATLESLVQQSGSGLLRIHRCYAVKSTELHSVDRQSVRLRNGIRLPLGNRYRAQVEALSDFVPSSQTA